MPYKDPAKRREYRKVWYSKNKQSELNHVKNRKKMIKMWFVQYKKGLKCLNCGENHLATLEFHHNSSNKENNISKMVSEGYSIKKIQDELKKCDVLCANCHRKLHFKKNKFKKP